MSQSTTPAMYYWYFVEPNLADLRSRPGDVRVAFNAAVSAFHLSDVFFEYYRRHDPARLPNLDRKEFLMFLGKQERAFVTVQTAATVYKHLYASKPFLDGCSPQSFGGVVTVDGETMEGGWKESGTEYVTIKKKDGSLISLNDALEKVICGLWPKILGQDLEIS